MIEELISLSSQLSSFIKYLKNYQESKSINKG